MPAPSRARDVPPRTAHVAAAVTATAASGRCRTARSAADAREQRTGERRRDEGGAGTDGIRVQPPLQARHGLAEPGHRV